MGLFSASNNKVEYGVIVDIGSGSVLVAVVESDPNKTHPEIIWSKREYTLLKQIESLETSAKSVITSLANVLMLFDTKGRVALNEYKEGVKITSLQVTISAPWSYTISKTIRYDNEKPFSVSKDLLEDLLNLANEKVDLELEENEKLNKTNLEIISRVTADIIANGYPVKVITKQKATSLSVIQLNAIAQERITGKMDELHDQLFPKVYLERFSFMLAFYYTIINLYPDNQECCLVDVTYEATEIGVVRGGVLQYCSHIPFGLVSLAREISASLKVPLVEAKSYLADGNLSICLEKYSEKQKKEVYSAIGAYQEKLVELLQETGDKLSVPRSLFLHVDNASAEFFKTQISEVANKITKSSHVVYNVTNDILTCHYPEEKQQELKNKQSDTAMLISAQFFHTQNYNRNFEQL